MLPDRHADPGKQRAPLSGYNLGYVRASLQNLEKAEIGAKPATVCRGEREPFKNSMVCRWGPGADTCFECSPCVNTELDQNGVVMPKMCLCTK